MQDLMLTPGTVVVVAVIVAWAVWAIRRMTHRGLCDCGDHCGDAGCSGCHGGCSCSAADKMVADLDAALGKQRDA